MERQQSHIIDGVIWKQLLIFFFPIMMGTFFQQLYNTLDAVIVGRFVGKVALAAVGGPTGTLINLLLGFFIGISAGASVVIAQFYGAELYERVNRAIHTSVALAIAVGIMMTIGGWLASPWALRMMYTPAEVMPYAITYIRIYFAGVIFALLYNMGAAILRAMGDSKRPFYLLVMTTILNLVLDLLFVVVIPWGVAGVAIGTVIAQAVSAACVWFMLARGPAEIRLRLRLLRFDFKILKRIVAIGLPTGLQSMMYTSSNIVIQSSINSFGVDTIAAWAILGKIDGLYWMIMTAFGVSITTFAGQNFGAKRYDRIRESVRVCTYMAFTVSIVFSALMMCFGSHAFLIFTMDQQVINIGMQLMYSTVTYYFTYVFIEVISGVMRGVGYAVPPTVITCVGVCVLRLLWVWFVLPWRHEAIVLVWSYPLSWTITSLVFLFWYFKSHWLLKSIARVIASRREKIGA